MRRLQRQPRQQTAEAAAAGEGAAAPAGKFDWGMCKGTELKLLLNQHPYQQALVGELPKFEELTGMKVTYDVVPEQNYFDKVTIDLQAGDASTYDAFMTGAYMIWQYAPAGWMEPLEGYINDPAKTNPDYDFEDILARPAQFRDVEPGSRPPPTWARAPSMRFRGVGKPMPTCIARTSWMQQV